MPIHPKFLWIVPMFHCNGWCFPWTMAAAAGTSYFLRQIRPDNLFYIINKYKVQYFAGAPVTMNTMLGYDKKIKFSHHIQMWAAGAPPPTSVIKRFTEEIGIKVQCAYGLTETYGPICTHNVDYDWINDINSRNNNNDHDNLNYDKNDIINDSIADNKSKGTKKWQPLTQNELLLKSTYLSCDTTVESLKVDISNWMNNPIRACTHMDISLCKLVYVYMYVCMYVCIHVCEYVSVCMHV